MLYPVLTYSRNLGDFTHDISKLHQHGLKAIRLIYKGKTEDEFNRRIAEMQKWLSARNIDLDIWIDLPGKKPIAGDLGFGLEITAGMEIHLCEQGMKHHSRHKHLLPTLHFFNHKNFPMLEAGDIISIADDELNILVKEIKENRVICEALNSFFLTSNRSMNVKNKPFDMVANSEADLEFVRNMADISKNIKLVVSFTRTAEDLLKIKTLQPEVEVIPKIETLIDEVNLLEILDCCETVLLGRGDLSIECKPNELFGFQEKLIHLCKQHNKKLVVGTGLLANISDKQSPTISEIMDYSYLRRENIEGFLLAGSNALNFPLQILEFMEEFEISVKKSARNFRIYKMPQIKDRVKALQLYMECNASDDIGENWEHFHNHEIISHLNSLSETDCQRLMTEMWLWGDEVYSNLADPFLVISNPNLDGDFLYCKIFMETSDAELEEYLLENLTVGGIQKGSQPITFFLDLESKAKRVNERLNGGWTIRIEGIRQKIEEEIQMR